MKFLIDECLSPDLALIARDRGHPGSTHVRWLGLASAGDWTIAKRAFEDGFVLVTHNRLDFLKLYRGASLHSGLVCLNAAHGMMNREQQRRLFTLALLQLPGSEPYNEVMEITLETGGDLVIARYAHPQDP